MHRYLSLFLLLTALLYAGKDVSATLEVSTLHPVVKEPVILKLHIHPNRTDKVLNFEFNPRSTSEYLFKFLESTEKKRRSAQNEVTFTYALFPLKSGKIDFRLHFTYREATKEEVKKFVTGSADELTYLQTTNITIPLEPFSLDVSPLQKDTRLVGDFTLHMDLDKNRTNADEQINVTYELKGRGFKPQIDNPLKISNVEMFLSHEHFENRLFYKELYRYAILSDHNFTLPSLSIKAYSPEKRRYYTLTTDAVPIVVTRPETAHTSSLMLTINKKTLLSFLKEFVNYLYFFLGGLFTALIVKRFLKEREVRFIDRVKKAGDPYELLHLLLSSDFERYNDEITELEEALYGNKNVSLRMLKRHIIRKSESHSDISL